MYKTVHESGVKIILARFRLCVQNISIKPTVNDVLREWRDLWPGGLREEQYSTLNLIAHCRHGELGYNQSACGKCQHREWYASSCGDRHCPMCLGPRQAEWAEKACGRLPDCPHFHVVFTVPEELHAFFEANYRIASDLLFAAGSETLKTFQKNNWKMTGGFLAVEHTWGSALHWHPHLHVLVGAGGEDLKTGRWKEARRNYLFPVRNMSGVYRAIFLRMLEQLDTHPEVLWPAALATVESRRNWRLKLAGRNWNIFSRATLGNTRAVVRYLARYTSRIAISNQRLTAVDEEARTVSFVWTDYRNGGGKDTMTLTGREFLHRFTRHLVPKGFRRVRYYGLLAGKACRHREIPGSPQTGINEKAAATPARCCPQCGADAWFHLVFYSRNHGVPGEATKIEPAENRFSLLHSRAGPRYRPTSG